MSGHRASEQEDFDLSLQEIRETARLIAGRTLRTPLIPWQEAELERRLGPGTEVFLKLELLQRTGTFKARGALNTLLRLSADERRAGVTCFSAGNHAIAVSWAARQVGSSAKVVMPRNANPARVARCREEGAEVVLGESISDLIAIVERIRAEEGRTFVHPYEGRNTLLGTATVGLEIALQMERPEAVVVPVGGGGLIAGIATALGKLAPEAKVYGVEPEGACSLTRSLAAGRPMEAERVETIADSLGAPSAMPMSFALAKRHVARVELVSDDLLRAAMAFVFERLKLAVEPAGAAALAGAVGPLREELAGKRVLLLVCGSNIDRESYCRHLTAAGPLP